MTCRRGFSRAYRYRNARIRLSTTRGIRHAHLRTHRFRRRRARRPRAGFQRAARQARAVGDFHPPRLLGASGLVLLIVTVLQGQGAGRVTAALGILVVAALGGFYLASLHLRKPVAPKAVVFVHAGVAVVGFRSEERRVGKECVIPCSSRWSPYHSQSN